MQEFLTQLMQLFSNIFNFEGDAEVGNIFTMIRNFFENLFKTGE